MFLEMWVCHQALPRCCRCRRVAPGSVDVVLSYCHYCLNDKSLLRWGSPPSLPCPFSAHPCLLGCLHRMPFWGWRVCPLWLLGVVRFVSLKSVFALST